MHLQFLWHTQSTSLLRSHFLGWHYKKKLMSCCAVLKATKYEKQLSWCYVSRSSPCAINSLSVANINRKTVGQLWATNFGFAARSFNSQLVMPKICSHFATSSGFVHLVKQNPSSPHETLHIVTNAILISDGKNNRSCHWLQCTCSQ